MKAKLNLTIDDDLLGRVKRYAERQRVSVSELVESYFRSLTKSRKKKNIVELVDGLDGPQTSLPDDLTKAYYEEQENRHGG